MKKEQINNNKEKKLILSAVLNFSTTLAQIIGGLISGSLSLISDALHNLSDAVALVISLMAVKLSKKENTEQRTFGFKRAEILAALFNSSVLVVISVYLFREAFVRLFDPHPINSLLMFFVALVGLASNLISVFLLKKHAHEDLNVRAAYVHLFADFLSSIAVILGAGIIFIFKSYWIDPVLTFIIGIYVLKEGYRIIEESIHILMQNVPKGIDVKDIEKEVAGFDGIKDIHHAHIWCVTEKEVHMEAHINVSKDVHVSETCILKNKIEKLLKERFGITHVTIQFEYDSCKDVSFIKK